MYQISSEKFGKFINNLRKEKNLTQKELAEKLFVSDKTISKWECGMSIPNVGLLIPIAEVLEVSVTELLKGERINNTVSLDASEVENLVVGSLDLSLRNMLSQHKKQWVLAYLICLLITMAEIALLTTSGLSLSLMKDNVLSACGLTLVFSGWFCFFAKEVLPVYHDTNRINYYAQGIFRMHLPGLSINNSNWPYICRLFKSIMMAIAIIYPLICYGSLIIGGTTLWMQIKMIVLFSLLAIFIIVTYIIAKKYE